MATKEIIDYIKTQLSAGIARENITSDLLQGGWTMEQINEAFQSARQSAPAQIPQQEIGLEMTQAPKTIKYFEWLMYTSFATSVVIWIFQSGSVSLSAMIAMVLIPFTFIGILIKFACVYRVVYHRAKWARIGLVILLAISAFSIFGFSFYARSNPLPLVTALPIVLEIAAIYFVFTTPSSTWLTPYKNSQEEGAYTADNKKWSKIIPWLNIGFMVISALSVFVLDLPLLIRSPELAPFFYVMLVVLAIFIAFFLYENRTLKRKFANSDSRLDSWFVRLVILRNLVFLLSVIPVIQIGGTAAMVFGGIPYIIIYSRMLRARNKSIATV
ncbi:MAG: hypothetical protein Q8P93_03905 [bacterium]|nr:hypothetical protein [bacterium]